MSVPVSMRPSRAELLALTPAAAIQPRPQRYVGDSVAASIAALHPADAAIVREIYGFLGELYAVHGLAALRAHVDEAALTGLIRRVRRLGAALVADGLSLALRKVYHDLRGGSLAALVMLLADVAAGEANEQDADQIFLLVRDHRKIMRNALPDLDPAGYAEDLCPREHDAALLVQKWSGATYQIGEAKKVAVEVDCDFAGGVSECCMEFAALDRVIYNLINNAARFAADGVVSFTALPISAATATDLRFVISNRVTEAQQALLVRDLEGDLSRIFRGGYTTGGVGVGLQICGDFITHGYGLSSVSAALRDGYLGARLIRDCFVAWFHWPARRSGEHG
jgi:signal transduction histidine kinase